MARNNRSLISASEVGDYVFCALAWRLRAEGHEPTSLRAAQEAGTKWHRDHGKGVGRARRLHNAAIVFLVVASLLTLLVLYLALR